MKIRDLLVIVFTVIVALLLLCRSSRPDGSRPVRSLGGHEGASSTGKLHRASR